MQSPAHEKQRCAAEPHLLAIQAPVTSSLRVQGGLPKLYQQILHYLEEL